MNPYRIIIIDDHELLRMALSGVINRQPDMEVCGEAATESEAFKIVGETRPDGGVIDLKLREGSGLNLIRRVRSVHESFRPLVVSMFDDDVMAEQAQVLCGL